MKQAMKRISILISIAAAVFAVSCAPEVMTPDKSKLPMASELTPVIEINQETNYVTFSVADQGVVPIWIFGEERIDGKASKKYSYTQNGVTLRIREAGEHSVELKAYNANGISQGSQIVTFNLENTYRDPFDPTPYMKAVANSWVWDADNAGHFGCGPDASNPTGWWNCGAHDKDGYGLYDDILTFDAEGNFTHDPGEGGTIYVNWGSGFKPEGHEAEIASETDYQAPVDVTTSKYTVENSWNDAGIEEIYLVLEEGQYLSYIPNSDAISSNARYQFIETKTSAIKKNLALVNANANIAWKYSFIPYVKEAGPEELLAGTDPAGKVWVMDSETAGHLGCGPDGSNPGGWWSAGPNEKAGFGMYDDELTFCPDGTYYFSPGADGKIYVNKDVTDLLGSPASEDVDIDFEAQTSTYDFDGETIKFPAGIVIGYVPNNAWLSDATFHVTEITETTLVGYTVTDGIAWQYKFRARDIVGPSQSIAGVAVEGGKCDVSLTNGQTVDVVGIEMKSIDQDYFVAAGSSLKFIAPSGDYRIYVQDGFLKVIPLVDGEAAVYPNTIWVIGVGAGKPQGKEAGWATGEATDIPFVKTGDKTYSVTLYCTSGTNIKLFEQPNWGDDNTGERVWLKNRYASINGNGYLDIPNADGNLAAAAGLVEGWYTITVTDTDGEGALALEVNEAAEVEQPFVLGEEIDLSEVDMDFLAGTWTWEASTSGHFGCGDSAGNPTGWWNADPNAKDGCHMYDDCMSFTADGKYTFDPVDGQTYMNVGCTKMDAAKVEQAAGDDWVVNVDKMENIAYELSKDGGNPVITLPANTIFSYIPNDAFLAEPELTVTAAWTNQIELSAGPASAGIYWRYRLKRK